MIKIKSKTITMTRGDSLVVAVNLKINGETYEPQEGDVVLFALGTGYKGNTDYELLISKNIPTDTMLLELLPSDTAEMDYGKYNYDIQVTFANGRVVTAVQSTLELTGEVA